MVYTKYTVLQLKTGADNSESVRRGGAGSTFLSNNLYPVAWISRQRSREINFRFVLFLAPVQRSKPILNRRITNYYFRIGPLLYKSHFSRVPARRRRRRRRPASCDFPQFPPSTFFVPRESQIRKNNTFRGGLCTR